MPAIDFSELDKLVPAELKEKNTPGAVIAIISGDQVVYQKAFGVANVETNAEMQPEMLFRLGSTTKMFTAAALLTLAEKNKIKMNEPIGNRVKGLNARVGQVTPHHLLSNSAGVRDFAAPVISNDDPALGNMVRSWKDDVFFADQGEIYSYSSPGYWLSGFVVEELHGKPYADAMTELLFKPLGMERTTLRPFMAITYPFATGHALDAGKPTILRPMFNNVAMWPAGSMLSNVKDLSRWVIALLNEGKLDGKQLLSPALINQMVQHHVPVPGEPDSYYGYGLTVFKYKGIEFVRPWRLQSWLRIDDPDGAVAKVCGDSVDEQEWRDDAKELEQGDGAGTWFERRRGTEARGCRTGNRVRDESVCWNLLARTANVGSLSERRQTVHEV